MFSFVRRLVTLMGVTYEYPEIAPVAPVAPRRVVLEEPRPDLDRQELLIREHRRRGMNSEVSVLPRGAIEALIGGDVPMANSARSSAADAVARRRRALETDYADAPVLPPAARNKPLTVEELALYEKQRLRALRRDEMTLVPVQRRAS